MTRHLVLDPALARRWMRLAVKGLADSRDAIDALNVYPVPDGDTGTNLHLTLRRAVQEAASCGPQTPLADLLDALARGALLGARGNSGIIVSQLLRGWADAYVGARSADAALVVRGLQLADRQAWQAVQTPVEGTILSVTRAAALAAAAALEELSVPTPEHGTASPGSGTPADEGGVRAVVRAAGRAAHQALQRTTEQLPVLAEAGVVDAGGAGVVVLFDALVSAVCGEPAPALPVAVVGPVPRVQRCPSLSVDGPAFEVMYLLGADDAVIAAVRAGLADLGDSLVVVGGSGLWHVHVHTDDPGGAVELAVRHGSPHRIRITHLPSGDPAPQRPEAATAPTAPSAGLGVVGVATGPGLANIFTDAGAVAVTTGSGGRVSTEELLSAIRRTRARQVVVLPNDTDTIPVARVAADAAAADGLQVVVLPTRAQVEGLAAVAVVDPDADLEEAVRAMTEAAAGTRHGAVSVASRSAATPAGRCRPGTVLGLVSGEITRLGDDVEAMALQVLGDLVAGGAELVTVVLGRDAPAGLAERLATPGAAGSPTEGVEIQVLDGGQPAYPVLIGVE